MLNQFSRTELLIGEEGIKKLQSAKVAIFGLGGVGSFVLEGLVRAGIKQFVLIDNDKVDITNLNRQLIATRKTVGKNKVEVAKERILEINPDAEVTTYCEFYMPGTNSNILTSDLSYVIDCIDTVTAKIDIAVKCKELNIPEISAMGTGNKLDPSKFIITDIYNTSVCPLAKVMRKELKKRNVESLKVIYSKEEPIKQIKVESDGDGKYDKKYEEKNNGKPVPGSISFVPSVAGLMIAGEVVRDLLN